MNNVITRAERAEQLEAVDKFADLQVEGTRVGLEIKNGTSKVDARQLILDATFGPGSADDATVEVNDIDNPPAEGTPPEGGDTSPSEGDGAPPATEPPAQPGNGYGEPPEEESDPMSQQADEIDAQLGALYDQLVVQIKEAATPGVSGDTAEQLRAGAVQFLRQCNATLDAARQLIEEGKNINQRNNEQMQGIERAKLDLERRSQEYSLLAKGKGKQEDADA